MAMTHKSSTSVKPVRRDMQTPMPKENAVPREKLLCAGCCYTARVGTEANITATCGFARNRRLAREFNRLPESLLRPSAWAISLEQARHANCENQYACHQPNQKRLDGKSDGPSS